MSAQDADQPGEFIAISPAVRLTMLAAAGLLPCIDKPHYPIRDGSRIIWQTRDGDCRCHPVSARMPAADGAE